MWKPASLLSPRLGGAEAPPFRKGGFEVHTHCHRSSDTGRVREVTNTDQPGAHCPRALPAEIDNMPQKVYNKKDVELCT